jgi:hypothetical protein
MHTAHVEVLDAIDELDAVIDDDDQRATNTAGQLGNHACNKTTTHKMSSIHTQPDSHKENQKMSKFKYSSCLQMLTLVHASHAFLGHDLTEAIQRALVSPLVLGLLRLQHHTTAHSVEGLDEKNKDKGRQGNETTARAKRERSKYIVEGHDCRTGNSDGNEGRNTTQSTLVLGIAA